MRTMIVATLILLVYSGAVDGNTVIESCCDVAMKGCSYFSTTTRQPAIYKITDCCDEGLVTQGYCDTITDGGGWLVIQRRQQGTDEDFDRFWSDYERGFGNLKSEFWYGLRPMHCLTNRGTWELLIDFTYNNGTKSYLHYDHFRVSPSTDNYRLNISGFTGISSKDPFTTHLINGQQFSTRNRANDHDKDCAITAHGSTAPGGWWHYNCFHINLNYNHGGPLGFINLAGQWYNPIFIEMKIRPVNCEI